VVRKLKGSVSQLYKGFMFGGYFRGLLGRGKGTGGPHTREVRLWFLELGK
jgi:hypothetical protein